MIFIVIYNKTGDFLIKINFFDRFSHVVMT